MTKGSLWNEQDRAAIVSRVNRLTPENQRRWGVMERSRLLPHMGDALRMALGDIEPRRGKAFTATALMRRLIIIESASIAELAGAIYSQESLPNPFRVSHNTSALRRPS